jgi:ligand-binding sensor domain-containing protein/anti-sigma regulatory factor (Ser/Thr protein kinase)
LPHVIEKLTTQNGLSSNNINDLAQDDNGFLWIATSDGLDRFDGTEVVEYFHMANKNSLAHNYVYCLKKLPNNYLAIGTQGGISFYNGNTGMFKNFYYKHDPVMDEYNNTILELETDSKGNLWASSRNCIFIFDPALQLKQILSSPFTQADALKERLRFADKILPLSNGDILLYLYNGWHIYSLKSQKIIDSKSSAQLQQLKFLNDISYPNLNKYFTSTHLFTIFGKYFACIPASLDSLFVFDEGGNRVSSCFFAYNKYSYVWWSQHISVIDSSRLLFLFNDTGLAIIHVAWKDKKPLLQNLSPVLFGDYSYQTALRDDQKNWWLATTGTGIQKISQYKQFFKSESLINKRSGEQIKSEVVSLNKINNTIWTATYGDGFFETDLSTGRQRQHIFHNTNDDTWANYIWNIHRASNDTIWVGTQTGMFWYNISSQRSGRLRYKDKPAAIDSVPITTQFTDSHGLVWIGLGKGKGLCCYDNKHKSFTYYAGNNAQGYPLRYPTSIAEDAHNNLWFVNDASKILIHWIRNTNEFRSISLPSVIQKQVGDLNGIWCEGDTVLWLGSVTCGLIKYNIVSNSIKVYGHENGLSNTHITGIFEDDKKRIWLINDGGLSCFDQHSENFINYTPKNGLPVQYPTNYFYYDTSTSHLYAGGNGAFFYFDPNIITFNQPPEKTLITAMQVNGKNFMMNKDEPAKFNPQQNDITIHYTAVDLANGADTKYAYKLIGEDTGWIAAGNQRQINFSHLAPGNYTFMVRAANNSGIWSDQTASIQFTILPPFTQTIWFYLLVLSGIGGIFYSLYRFRLNQLMRTELVRSEISKNLHDEVGSNLTNISLSSLLAQKQLQNTDALTKLLQRIYEDSQTVSEAMREIVWSINPKIDTMGDALPRMLRFASELLEANNIALQAEIAPEVEQLKLNMKERHDVYLIFKETINNIAKHSKATCVQVKFLLENNRLVMMITDNGKGFNTNEPLVNNGLKNITERAQFHKWNLHVSSEQGYGTTVTLRS